MSKYEKKVNDAIRDCCWRKFVHGTSVCSALCMPCIECIHMGECITLGKLFKNEKNEVKEKEN